MNQINGASPNNNHLTVTHPRALRLSQHERAGLAPDARCVGNRYPSGATVPCSRHSGRYRAGCEDCRRYAREIARARYRAKAYGRYVPRQKAEPIRRHVLALHQAGMSWSQISRASGISVPTLSELRRGLRSRVAAETARALLAVRAGTTVREGHVDATGTCRRVRALLALGHTVAAQAGWYGTTQDTVDRWMYGRVQWVTRQRAEQVRRCYDEFSMTPAAPGYGADRARRRAARRGWPPPLAWDDERIDDPAAGPATGECDDGVLAAYDEAKVLRAVDGHLPYPELTHAERREAVRRLHGRGLNDAQLAQILRTDVKTVGRRRMRMRLPANVAPGGAYPRSA